MEIKKDESTRDPEISEKEGVGYILKVCGEKGDFADKPESKQETEPEPKPKEEVEEPPSKKKKLDPKKMTRGAKVFRGSKDLPTKAQVDAQQVSFLFFEIIKGNSSNFVLHIVYY